MRFRIICLSNGEKLPAHPPAHRSLRVAFSLVVVLLAFLFVFRFFVFLILVSGNSSKQGVIDQAIRGSS